MVQDLFSVGADGQLVVNWDSLELITSDVFVKAIQSDLEQKSYDDIQRWNLLSVDNNNFYVKVILIHFQLDRFHIHTFYKESKIISYDVLNLSELKVINQFLLDKGEKITNGKK